MSSFRFTDAPQATHRVHRQPGHDALVVDGTPVPVRADGPGRFAVTQAGRTQRVHALAHGDEVFVQLDGRAVRLQRIDPLRRQAGAGGAAAGEVHAPMPGVVVSWQVATGQKVVEGDALVVIESMKLQTTLTAACSGTVAELPLAPGQTFQRGALLARVQPAAVDGGDA